MKQELENALVLKSQQHLVMATKEAELSLHIASTKNAQWRSKLQGDRKLISQRLTLVLHEIAGLASLITEQTYEEAKA